MKKTNKFSPEVRERAVRLVQEHRGEYPSLWAAIESIAPKIGCVPQTLNEWASSQASIAPGLPRGICMSRSSSDSSAKPFPQLALKLMYWVCATRNGASYCSSRSGTMNVLSPSFLAVSEAI